MSHRHSDSKRRHSKFDREPSPKRYRRDEKQERERDRERDRNEGDHNHKDRDQRKLSPPHHSRQEPADAAHKKPNSKDHFEHPSQPPRSRSQFQHDGRGSAGQLDRSSGRREAGEKVFSQSKENDERVVASQDREQTNAKSQAKLDDNLQRTERRDVLPEKKDDPPPSVRKRPAFREKKIPVDSKDANPAVAVAAKPSHTDHPPERNERKMERSSNPRHQDRPDRPIAEDRTSNKSEARRDGFSSRARYGGNNNDRGRGSFNGRQGYPPIKTQTEKWKHDLYQEVNKDPIPKNEDEQIAKLEALLAS